MNQITPANFRQTLGHFASGVTVITTQHTTPVGFTCASFYSVSVNPPLVSFCVMKESHSLPTLLATQRFAVNILSQEQQALSDQFARRGEDKFQGVDYRLSSLGNPLLAGCLAWLDCTLYATYEAGDHYLIIGEVQTLDHAQEGQALGYFKGQYCRLI